MPSIPFTHIQWSGIPVTIHPGTTGTAQWQTVQHPGLRIRRVVYSPGYLADHWCQRGHIVQCLQGLFVSEEESGENTTLHTGDTYVVTDGASSHRSHSAEGAVLLIVDGDFFGAGL